MRPARYPTSHWNCPSVSAAWRCQSSTGTAAATTSVVISSRRSCLCCAARATRFKYARWTGKQPHSRPARADLLELVGLATDRGGMTERAELGGVAAEEQADDPVGEPPQLAADAGHQREVIAARQPPGKAPAPAQPDRLGHGLAAAHVDEHAQR